MPSLKDFRIRAVLGYRDIFRQPSPANHLHNLSKYPTDFLIMALSKINAILFYRRGTTFESDQEILQIVFHKLDGGFVASLIENLKRYKGAMVIFYSPPIVMLMGQLITRFKPIEDNDISSEKELETFYKNLFASILATNDTYYSHIDGENKNTLDHIWKLALRHQQYARNVNNLFGIVPLKTSLFFRFMGERFGNDVLKEFADSFGLKQPEQLYLTLLMSIGTMASEFESKGQPIYAIDDKNLERVIKPFTVDPTSPNKILYTGKSYELINQPFYKLEKGVAVLDIAFFSHLTDIGLQYHFYQSTSLKQNQETKNYNTYLGIVGKHFIEEYLILEIIKKQFTHLHDKIYCDKDDPAYPDILIIHNAIDALVIEIKSTRINGKDLGDTDITRFQKALEDNYASEKTKVGEKNKGIFQLKKQIQHLKKKNNKLRIFPIIIYTDPVMDIPGINTFLDDKFELIINTERTSSGKIYPLTCINLHFFIEFYRQLKEQRYFLRNSIIEYHKKRKSGLKKAGKTNNPSDYLIAQFSFSRSMEQFHQMDTPIDYFNLAAKDFGFKTE